MSIQDRLKTLEKKFGELSLGGESWLRHPISSFTYKEKTYYWVKEGNSYWWREKKDAEKLIKEERERANIHTILVCLPVKSDKQEEAIMELTQT